MSGANRDTASTNCAAWPERPAPQEQERDR
jgi:hypothetical protein